MLQDRPRTGDGRVIHQSEAIREFSSPLQTAADLDPLMERIGNARFVLLGDATPRQPL